MENHFHHTIQSQSQNNDQNVTISKIPLAVVMVPLPAQGHLNQLLHLSRLVSAHDIPVHFVGTTTHNRQTLIRVHGWDPLAVPNIKFHDLPSPTLSDALLDPNSLDKFPTQILPSLISFTKLRAPVYNLVEKLSAKVGKIVVIYDSLMPYVVQDISSIPNAESYCFQSISAFSLYSFYWEGKGKPILATVYEIIKEVPSIEGCVPPECLHHKIIWAFELQSPNNPNLLKFEKKKIGSTELLEFSKIQEDAPKFNSGDLYNTCRVIEGLYVDLLAKEKSTGTDKNWAIGPFNPVSITRKMDFIIRHDCLDWLDKQELKFVIFISFGSTSSLSNDQIKEIAFRLERSKVKFIWVLRDADKLDIFEGEVQKIELSEGFEERIQERGIIVRDWAPQLEILGHPSTGGFISHCGWNSCMESISMGVPIATWPMQFDQPRNAFLITKVLKIGVELKNWDRRDELISSHAVEKAVKTLMSSAEGDEIRKRVTDLGNAVKNSLMEGGVTKKEMDSFIAHISK